MEVWDEPHNIALVPTGGVRVANPRCEDPVTLALKIAERWTLPQLEEAIQRREGPNFSAVGEPGLRSETARRSKASTVGVPSTPESQGRRACRKYWRNQSRTCSPNASRTAAQA